MADDILNGLSTNELSREILKCVAEEQRSLPPRAKTFAAVAKLQRFDVLPEVSDVEAINVAITQGGIQLNRGLSATKGVGAIFYAKELAYGALYPGTLSALGNGIYFAVPSEVREEFGPAFPLVSKVALKYTIGDPQTSGCIIRAVLKPTAKVVDCDDLRDDLRQNRNRAKSAGITDIGTFAAALGIDAYFVDGVYPDTNERIYTVLNRGCLSLQRTVKNVRN